MGRIKLDLKRIEKSTSRQITYSKRKKGLLKKANELSTLCDIDLALLMFSPLRPPLFFFQSNKYLVEVQPSVDTFLHITEALVTRSSGTFSKIVEIRIRSTNQFHLLLHNLSPSFSGLPQLGLFAIFFFRIEDVFARYINLPDQERENAIVFPDQSKRQGIQNKEYLLRTLEQLKTEDDMALLINEPRPIHTDVEALEQEVCRLQQQLQISEEELRKFEQDPVRCISMEEIEACETHLTDTLTRVVQRREHLLNKSCKAAEPKQAHMITNSAHHSNQLSYDLLLQGSTSSWNQNPK